MRGREPECVEIRYERLVAVRVLPQLRHNGGVGRAAAGVDQKEFGVGGAVDGNQIADEDLVRGVLQGEKRRELIGSFGTRIERYLIKNLLNNQRM